MAGRRGKGTVGVLVIEATPGALAGLSSAWDLHLANPSVSGRHTCGTPRLRGGRRGQMKVLCRFRHDSEVSRVTFMKQDETPLLIFDSTHTFDYSTVEV